MIATKQPSELKPGDLFVLAAGHAFIKSLEYFKPMPIGEKIKPSPLPMMRLVERHPCSALEFLVLPPEQSA
jgi:hypothetical protein